MELGSRDPANQELEGERRIIVLDLLSLRQMFVLIKILFSHPHCGPNLIFYTSLRTTPSVSKESRPLGQVTNFCCRHFLHLHFCLFF